MDVVRASRAGHEFHEAWLARRALALLPPSTSLCGIAVEGLGPDDQEGAAAAVVEIADATFYFGDHPTFQDASSVEIAQFKYSIARKTAPFRAADAAKTIDKFAKGEITLPKLHGTNVLSKVSYAIYTNRPVAPELLAAVAAFAGGVEPTGAKARAQYEYLSGIMPQDKQRQRAFASRLRFVGAGGDLSAVRSLSEKIIADWSATSDVSVRARVGDLKQLIRDKAGPPGNHNNLLVREDVLGALGQWEEGDFLPTPAAFPDPGQIVRRDQVDQFMSELGNGPLHLISAAGGVGKTVFVQSVAQTLSGTDEVILFDCFGGGAYRSPLDGRHQAERGLMHIVNDLACRGLCDLILPRSGDPIEVVRRSLARFRQAIETLRRTRPAARLVIILDAADNADMEATDRGQRSFPRLLFEALTHEGPIDGLIVIATARPERAEAALGRSTYRPYLLRGFTPSETAQFVRARHPEITQEQTGLLHRRALGNPRVVANLLQLGVPQNGSEDAVQLPDLIQKQLEHAIEVADLKGSEPDQVAAFLCAVSILPPPVPLAEIAAAFGATGAQIESFVSDLSPAIEATPYGLIFRDEPTETLIRASYGKRPDLLDGVATRLLAAQDHSIYAARSLPSVLFAMHRYELLRKLAFDSGMPASLTSDVARRAIRRNRIRTALHAAVLQGDQGSCVELSVELATLVVGEERGEEYLLSNPDLTVSLGNSEDMRRLFELKDVWPGRRHSRLAIAYSVGGDLTEAHAHARRADRWLTWADEQDEDEQRRLSPDKQDHAAVAVYLMAKGQIDRVVAYLNWWSPPYCYQVTKAALSSYDVGAQRGLVPPASELLTKLSRQKISPAIAAAVLTVYPEADPELLKAVLRNGMGRITVKTNLGDDYSSQRSDTLLRALLRSALRMVSFGLSTQARKVLRIVVPRRFDLWSLRDDWHTDELVDWAIYTAARTACDGTTPDIFDSLPATLWDLVRKDERPADDEQQLALTEIRLKEDNERAKTEGSRRAESGERYRAMEVVRERVRPLVNLARQMHAVAVSSATGLDLFCSAWPDAVAKAREASRYFRPEDKRFIDALHWRAASEVLRAFGPASAGASERLVSSWALSELRPAYGAIGFVAVLARSEQTHVLAGRMAVQAAKIIEAEDDVSTRTDLFAALARAILPANVDEARSLFARGLAELDALGSGDYNFAWELLNLASAVEAPIDPELVLRFSKICESSVYDSRKWPWRATASALVRLAGPGYLAQICRWHDRDKVDLELTLPAAVTELIDSRAVTPAVGLGLLRCVVSVGLSEWGWHDLLSAVIQHPLHTLRDAQDVVDQFQTTYSGRPPIHYLDALERVARLHPGVEGHLLPQFGNIRRSLNEPRRVIRKDHHAPVARHPAIDQRRRSAAIATARRLRLVDALSAESIEGFLEYFDTLDHAPRDQISLLGSLRASVRYTDRGKHLAALLGVRNLDLFDKVEVLKGVVRDWANDTPSLRGEIAVAGPSIVRDHADGILLKDWGPGGDVSKVAELTGVKAAVLAMELIRAGIDQELEPSSQTWLALAALIAKGTNASSARASIERLLESGAARLIDEVGDGPWTEALNPGTDAAEIVARATWFVLGSPEAQMRWRAAHSVRAYAERGETAIIDRLFACLAKPDAGAFKDPALPFFEMNARLWFLIAIARVAVDFPAVVEPHTDILAAIALDEGFPHVAMRQAAAEALRRTTQWAALREDELANVNLPRIPPVDRYKRPRDFPGERPKGVVDPEPHYYWDYDFEKTALSGLADAFGLPKWVVSDWALSHVVRWAPAIESMSNYAGKRQPRRREGYGLAEGHHSYGSYLAWHALAVTGGELLAERATGYNDWGNAWDDWLERFRITRSDGLWIADGTSAPPIVAFSDLLPASPEEDRPVADEMVLLKLAGLTRSKIAGQNLVVNARWCSPDRVTVHVETALVPRGKSQKAGLAVATAPPFHMWLPTLEGDDPPWGRSIFAPVSEWITREEVYGRLDEQDPLGSASAVAFYRPARKIIDALGLVALDNFKHRWAVDGNREALTYSAWGRPADGDEGAEAFNQLICDSRFLETLLATLNRDLLVLIKLERFHDRKTRTEGKEEEPRFTYSSVVARIDQKLRVSVIRPTQEDYEKVQAISQYDRPEFSSRYRALGGR